MNYHTLKNEGFCPNEVIHFSKTQEIDFLTDEEDSSDEFSDLL